MSQIKELSLAVNATDDWIHDLLRRPVGMIQKKSFSCSVSRVACAA